VVPQGEPELLDYSATKGAIVAFTRGLSQQLAEKGGSVMAGQDQGE
jgi:NAD(P)-dependent dehydrogenase (short-subunit alcohol dehydrogenase family)